MTIREKLKHKGMIVDCSGPDGNAFYLLGLAKNLARQLEWSEKETRMMLTEMKSSDYEHLILTFDKHFGWHVTLEWTQFYKIPSIINHIGQIRFIRRTCK